MWTATLASWTSIHQNCRELRPPWFPMVAAGGMPPGLLNCSISEQITRSIRLGIRRSTEAYMRCSSQIIAFMSEALSEALEDLHGGILLVWTWPQDNRRN